MSRLGVRNSPASSFRKSINLDSFIRFEAVKNRQGRALFRFVRFTLNQTSIQEILQARDTRKCLRLSRELLAELRYFSLSDGENRYWKNRFQSGLTFCSYYEPDGVSEQKSDNLVMRSVISLDGEVLHQIRRDCLDDSQECMAIATAHYWLINQMLIQLHLKTKIGFRFWLNWLVWGLALLVAAVVVISYAGRLSLMNFLILLAALIVGCWLLPQLIKRLLLLFQSRAWRQVLLFFTSSKRLEKNIAKAILGRFAP